MVADYCRHMSLTTTINSLRGGNWTKDGFFALFLGAFLCYRLGALRSRLSSSLQRMAMNSFQVNAMGDNENKRGVHCVHSWSLASQLYRVWLRMVQLHLGFAWTMVIFGRYYDIGRLYEREWSTSGSRTRVITRFN
jgi:hypothetical protein